MLGVGGKGRLLGLEGFPVRVVARPGRVPRALRRERPAGGQETGCAGYGTGPRGPPGGAATPPRPRLVGVSLDAPSGSHVRGSPAGEAGGRLGGKLRLRLRLRPRSGLSGEGLESLFSVHVDSCRWGWGLRGGPLGAVGGALAPFGAQLRLKISERRSGEAVQLTPWSHGACLSESQAEPGAAAPPTRGCPPPRSGSGARAPDPPAGAACVGPRPPHRGRGRLCSSSATQGHFICWLLARARGDFPPSPSTLHPGL